MKLEILVPQFSEDDAVIRPLLESIALQQGVDFREVGVQILNDGSDVLLTEKSTQGWPFRVKYGRIPHGGVSAARNALLDAAEGEYVMFCDADDMFLSALALSAIFREAAAGFDTLWSVFAEEARHPETKAPVYILREMDNTFVHGKVHRRSFLLEKRVRFDESLTVHEDGYFHTLLQCLGPDMRYCEKPFYLWRWRDGSVCRSEGFMLRTYPQLLDSRDALVAELARRGLQERADDAAAQTVLDAYYTMQKPEWKRPENMPYRRAAEKRFAAFWEKHMPRWLAMPERERAKLSAAMRSSAVKDGMVMETLTIGAWLRHIEDI